MSIDPAIPAQRMSGHYQMYAKHRAWRSTTRTRLTVNSQPEAMSIFA